MISPGMLEPIAMRAFPATRNEPLGEWVLRSDGALPNRRVNSAWDLGDPGLPLAAAVAQVEVWYRGQSKRSIIKTEPGSFTDQLLTTWSVEAPTGVYTRTSRPTRSSRVTFLAPDRLDEWCTAFTTVRGFDPSRAAGLVASYQALPDLALAVVIAGGSPIGVGLGVPDGEWLGLFDIATEPDARRRGVGSLITHALIGWGHDRGATTTYLQVEDENTGAIALYEKLGFVRRYGYHYRVRALEEGA